MQVHITTKKILALKYEPLTPKNGNLMQPCDVTFKSLPNGKKQSFPIRLQVAAAGWVLHILLREIGSRETLGMIPQSKDRTSSFPFSEWVYAPNFIELFNGLDEKEFVLRVWGLQTRDPFKNTASNPKPKKTKLIYRKVHRVDNDFSGCEFLVQ